MRSASWCAVLCLGAAGCGALSKPKTFAEQATAAIELDARNGHLDTSLQPVKGHELAYSQRSDVQLSVASVADGEMCVQSTMSAQHFEGHESVKQELAEYEEAGRAVIMALGAHDTLKALPKDAAWPPRPGTAKYRLVDHKVSKKDQLRESDLSTSHTEKLEVTHEWCAPAPAITSSTRYLTATVFKDDENALFVWVIDGAPGTSP